jgi:hypothetical protein
MSGKLLIIDPSDRNSPEISKEQIPSSATAIPTTIEDNRGSTLEEGDKEFSKSPDPSEVFWKRTDVSFW